MTTTLYTYNGDKEELRALQNKYLISEIISEQNLMNSTDL